MVENTYKSGQGIMPGQVAPPAVNVEDKEYGQDEAMTAEESRKKVVIRAIITVVAILIGIFLVLFIVSRAALYDSIPAMLGDMGVQLAEAIRRIFS